MPDISESWQLHTMWDQSNPKKKRRRPRDRVQEALALEQQAGQECNHEEAIQKLRITNRRAQVLVQRRKQRLDKANRAPSQTRQHQTGEVPGFAFSQPDSGLSPIDLQEYQALPCDGLNWPVFPAVDGQGHGIFRFMSGACNLTRFYHCIIQEYHQAGVAGEINKAGLDSLTDTMNNISVSNDTPSAKPSVNLGASAARRSTEDKHPQTTLARGTSELLYASLFSTASKILASIGPHDHQKFETNPVCFWEYLQDHTLSSGHWFSRDYMLLDNTDLPLIPAHELYIFALLATDARQYYLKHAKSRDIFKPLQPFAKAVDQFLAVGCQRMKESPAHEQLYGVYFKSYTGTSYIDVWDWISQCRESDESCEASKQGFVESSDENYMFSEAHRMRNAWVKMDKGQENLQFKGPGPGLMFMGQRGHEEASGTMMDTDMDMDMDMDVMMEDEEEL